MTIKYLDSKRISALSGDFIGTSGWTTSNSSSIGISGNEITIQERNGDYDEVAYKSFTALGADASFTFRFPIKITTITQTGGTDSIRVVMGVSSASDIADSTARDEVGIIWRVTDTINKFYAFTADGTALTSHYSGTDFATTPSTTGGDGNGNYYVEISGSGGTYTFKLFSDSTYDTLIESESITDAGITGLQYYVFRTWELTTHSNQARATVTISDKPTSVQDNSILVEKDTGNRYWFETATAPTYSGDLGTWATDGTQVTESSDVVTMNIQTRSTNQAVTNDLGANLSDSAWVMRCKLILSTITGGSGSTVYLELGVGSASASTGFANGGITQDFIGLQQRKSSDTDGWGLVGYDSTGTLDNPESPEMDTDPTTRTYYVEIKRLSTTSMSIGLYDSADYNTLISGLPVETKTDVPSGVTGLRYIRVGNAGMISETSGNVIAGTVQDIEIYNGVTSATPATWTMEPTYPYSSTGWSATGGGAVATNNITLALDTDGAQDQVNYDLTSISSDKFVLDFTLNFSRLTAGTNLFWFMGLVNSTNWIPTNSTNHMGIFAMQESGTKVFGCSDGTSTWNGASEDNQTWVATTGVDYYFRLTKLTSTTYKVELFGNSARTSVTSTSDGTVSSMTDLRYLVFTGDNNSGTGNATFTISDLNFYNGVTTIN